MKLRIALEQKMKEQGINGYPQLRTTDRICIVCGNTFKPRNKLHTICGYECRVKRNKIHNQAHRDRKWIP